LARDFNSAWKQQGGKLPYQVSSPVPVHMGSVNFGRPVKTMAVNNIVRARTATPAQIQRVKQLTAINEFWEGCSMAFHRCLDDLEKFGYTARYKH
jgi:hypothetical protein